MKFSVVVPCHNAGPWIEGALKSIADQTHPAHEVIVVNDSSTDDSVARVQSTGVATQILHVDHRNAAATRNAGIERATGDWLAFLDADNRWLPDHLENAAKILSGTGDVALMAHRVIVDPDAQDRKVPTPPVDKVQTGLTDEAFVHWLADCRYGFGTTGFVLRRDVVEAVGRFNTEQLRRHDWELFSRVVFGRTWSFEPRPTWEKRPPRPGDISSDEMSCMYYMLRGVIEMQRLYQRERLKRFAGVQARHAIAAAIRSGDRAAQARAATLGWPWLTRRDRVLAWGAMRCGWVRQMLIRRHELRQTPSQQTA